MCKIYAIYIRVFHFICIVGIYVSVISGRFFVCVDTTCNVAHNGVTFLLSEKKLKSLKTRCEKLLHKTYPYFGTFPVERAVKKSFYIEISIPDVGNKSSKKSNGSFIKQSHCATVSINVSTLCHSDYRT